MFDDFDDLDLIHHSIPIIEDVLQSQGNLIPPIIVSLKDGCVQHIQCEIPKTVLGFHDIREKVVETVKSFVFKESPDELIIVREGFFHGDASKKRYLSLIYSWPGGERTWISPICDREVGAWKEIKVLDGDLYNIFEKTFSPWN